MLLLQKKRLRFADFLEGIRSGHDRLYSTSLYALYQSVEHLRLKNGAPKQAEVFQIKGPDVQLHQRTGNGTRHGIPPTGTQQFQVLRPLITSYKVDERK